MMIPRFQSVFVLLALFTAPFCAANTFTTAASGFWNSPQSWQNGQIPPLSGGDIIIIDHDIMFQQLLNLVSATSITVNSTGSLCGHYQVIIPTGSNLYNNGGFYSDTVSLPGGHLYNYASGDMIVKVFGIVNNGGGWTNNSGSLQIGPDFTCGGKTIGITENNGNGLRIYPQPARKGNPVYIELAELNSEAELHLYSATGRDCGTFSLVNGTFYPADLPAGLYLLMIIVGENIYREKLLIAD